VILTIGDSTDELNNILRLLQAHDIALLVDVRLRPYRTQDILSMSTSRCGGQKRTLQALF